MPRTQFTLRALLVAMLVVGAFLGGWSAREEVARREAAARDRQFESKAQREARFAAEAARRKGQ